MKYDVAVLGAGISGLTAGLELSKKGKSVVIIEKEKDVGGLCRSFEHKGFVLDYGPHLLFLHRKETMNFIKNLNFSDSVYSKRMHHSLWYNGKLYDYTKNMDRLRLMLNFKRIPIFFAKLFLGREPREKNAEEWLISNLGKKSYEMFFRPILYKRFVREIKDINAVKLSRIIKIFIRYGLTGDEAYVKGGMGTFPLRIAEEFQKHGGHVITEVSVKKIEKKKDGFEISLKNKKINSKTVLSTIPPEAFSSVSNIKLPCIEYLHSIFIYFGMKEMGLRNNFDILLPDRFFWSQRVCELTLLCANVPEKGVICADRYFKKLPKDLEREKEKCMIGLRKLIPDFDKKIEWYKIITYPNTFALSKKMDRKNLPNGLFLLGQYCVEEEIFPSIDELVKRAIIVSEDINLHLESTT